jgi:hypothetical protein
MATCTFETGDWITPLSHYVSDYYRSYCVGLVFRLRAGNVYSIIGEVAPAALASHERLAIASSGNNFIRITLHPSMSHMTAKSFSSSR